MESGHKPSAISRLLHEISWEGSKVKLYRDGGRGMENALTAEVFQGLSHLPRDMFLGEILRCAHGADRARSAPASEVEHTDVDVLPGSLPVAALAIDVQPDVWMTGSSVQVLVEAKGFKKGAGFNREQLPRELLCLEAHSGGRAPLLPLILASPPPIRLTANGFHEVDSGVAVGLESVCDRAGMTVEDFERLRTAIPDCVAWITWAEIQGVVMRQKEALSGLPSSVAASVHRTAGGVAQAIRWHSGCVVTDLVEFAERSEN